MSDDLKGRARRDYWQSQIEAWQSSGQPEFGSSAPKSADFPHSLQQPCGFAGGFLGILVVARGDL